MEKEKEIDGDMLLGVLNGYLTEEENYKQLCIKFKEIIQSLSAEELTKYLLKTEFDFEDLTFGITFAFHTGLSQSPDQ